MKNKILNSVVLASIVAMAGALVISAESHADETSAANAEAAVSTSSRTPFQVGLLTGPTLSPDAGPSGLGMSYGARAEYKPTPLLGLGVFGTHTGFLDSNYIIASQTLQQTVLGAELKLYPFSNDGLYVGGKLGASILSSDITAWGGSTVSASHTDFIFGGSVGYNFKLGRSFSVGPEVSYLTMQNAGQAAHFISTSMTLNYWF